MELNVPEMVPPASSVNELPDWGLKPLIRATLSVPPSRPAPVKLSWSYWLPAVVPPSSIASVAVVWGGEFFRDNAGGGPPGGERGAETVWAPENARPRRPPG